MAIGGAVDRSSALSGAFEGSAMKCREAWKLYTLGIPVVKRSRVTRPSSYVNPRPSQLAAYKQHHPRSALLAPTFRQDPTMFCLQFRSAAEDITACR